MSSQNKGAMSCRTDGEEGKDYNIKEEKADVEDEDEIAHLRRLLRVPEYKLSPSPNLP